LPAVPELIVTEFNVKELTPEVEYIYIVPPLPFEAVGDVKVTPLKVIQILLVVEA
jgi:hypothetical protein